MRIYQRTNITKFPLRLCRVEGGGFLFPFIFLCAYHNLRLFYALAELVRRESVLGARKVRNLLTTRFLREITSHFRRRKIFHETDLSARFCKSVDSENKTERGEDYRSAGILPYYLISGKAFYKESDIQQMLEKAYRPLLDNQNLE